MITREAKADFKRNMEDYETGMALRLLRDCISSGYLKEYQVDLVIEDYLANGDFSEHLEVELDKEKSDEKKEIENDSDKVEELEKRVAELEAKVASLSKTSLTEKLILEAIGENPGIAQSELCRLLKTHSRTIKPMLQSLVKRDAISLIVKESNRNSYTIRDKGERMVFRKC